MVEHCPEANAADIAVGRPIDRVTEGHIIGRHCLRDRPGSASNMKETPGHFLSRSDLGKGAVTLRIEINLERFFVRSHVHLGLHAFQDVGICGVLNLGPGADAVSESRPLSGGDRDAQRSPLRTAALRPTGITTTAAPSRPH